ncbi:hypothetical protein IIA15_11405, partial [candidate division TA06 bacterium]|nr:hypothetical protein [candidate division TA06 bacterium]
VHITEERDALEKWIEEIQTAKVKIEERLRQEQVKLEAMTSDLKKERMGRLSVSESLSDNLSRVKREKQVLQAELSRVSQEKIEMEQELDQLRERLQEINEKRDQLAIQVRSINQILETRLREINQIRSIYEKTIDEARQIARVEADIVELPPIIVKGESSHNPSTISSPKSEFLWEGPNTEFPSPGMRGESPFGEVKNGRIVAVNDRYDFVVINLGKEDGVHEGMRFHVYREGEALGHVEVTEVRQKISACDVVVSESSLSFREGDLVIQ